MASRSGGAILKRHRLTQLRQIGEGSFGKALLVRSENGSLLVCKMIDVSQTSPKEAQDTINEAKLLASFKHPFIVEYAASFVDGGWLCILMTYCEGGDLFSQVDNARRARRHIEESQILLWMCQALLALKYIHDKHILHRDLKSGNFFLSQGKLKMGDFGIAKVLNRTQAVARTQIGTPLYLSPEACQEKPYTWPSDIWAMGIILYELCALKMPFDGGNNIIVLVRSICSGTPAPLPAHYSDFVKGLCDDMLKKNPAQRPSCGAILQRPPMKRVVDQIFKEARNPEAAPGPELTFGAYKRGDLVEYHSNSHNSWLQAVVVAVERDGVFIDLKPGTKLTKEQVDQLIRHRGRTPSPPVAGSEPEEAQPVSTQSLDQMLDAEESRFPPTVCPTQPAPSEAAPVRKKGVVELSLEEECSQLLQELGMDDGGFDKGVCGLDSVPEGDQLDVELDENVLGSLRAAEAAMLRQDLAEELAGGSLTAAELDLLAASLQV